MDTRSQRPGGYFQIFSYYQINTLLIFYISQSIFYQYKFYISKSIFGGVGNTDSCVLYSTPNILQ